LQIFEAFARLKGKVYKSYRPIFFELSEQDNIETCFLSEKCGLYTIPFLLIFGGIRVAQQHILWRRNMKIEYPNKFNPGDIAICKKFVRFVDNTYHMNGQRLVVTKQTQAYFNVNHLNYDKS
jgi:hypothetical protein